jgi:hypothetical protein
VASDEGSGEPRGTTSEIVPRSITADIRKFSDYVLVRGHESGKDRIFLDRLGFRERDADDAHALTELYLDQARSAIDAHDYELGEVGAYGRRCTIIVQVRGVAIRSGWFLRENGVLELVTPFSGFARPRREESR